MSAQMLYGEEMMVGQAGGGVKVLESGDFGRRTGIARPRPSMTPDWLALDFDLGGLREYTAAVFAWTGAFLEATDAGRARPHGDHAIGHGSHCR